MLHVSNIHICSEILIRKYKGDSTSIINAFLGLKNKRGYLYQVQNLSNALHQSLRRRENICFNFNSLSRALFGLEHFSSENPETKNLLALFLERTFLDPENENDANPASVRRALVGLTTMCCMDSHEVRGMLSLIAEAIEICPDDSYFSMYSMSRIFFALQNKSSETLEVRDILSALYNKRERMSWCEITPLSFGYVLYGFHNMSSDHIEVRKWANYFASINFNGDVVFDKYTLGRMFYGMQNMSNVSKEGGSVPELENLLNSVMNALDHADSKSLHCPITIAQILYGLQRFELKNIAHIRRLEGLFASLKDIANTCQFTDKKRPVSELMSPYQSIAFLKQQHAHLITSLSRYGVEEVIDEAFQVLGNCIQNIISDKSFSNKKTRSASEHRLFGVVLRAVADDNRAIVTFNDILHGFEADVVIHITGGDAESAVKRVINLEIDGSPHLNYRTKRFCELRDKVLASHGVIVIRANLVLLSQHHRKIKDQNDEVYSIVRRALDKFGSGNKERKVIIADN